MFAQAPKPKFSSVDEALCPIFDLEGAKYKGNTNKTKRLNNQSILLTILIELLQMKSNILQSTSHERKN